MRSHWQRLQSRSFFTKQQTVEGAESVRNCSTCWEKKKKTETHKTGRALVILHPCNPSTLLFSSPSPEFQMVMKVFPFSKLHNNNCILSTNDISLVWSNLHFWAEDIAVNPFLQRCGSLNNKSRGQTWLSVLLKKPIARSFSHRTWNTRVFFFYHGAMEKRSGQTGDVPGEEKYSKKQGQISAWPPGKKKRPWMYEHGLEISPVNLTKWKMSYRRLTTHSSSIFHYVGHGPLNVLHVCESKVL